VTTLYPAVVQRPDDLQVRHVLADLLLEQGDPLGEFIALQLGRTVSGERASAREKALLAEHGEAWLGRLVGLVHQVRFERGFVHHVQLLRATELPSGAERWSEWATVVSIDLRNLPEAVEVRLLGSPMFRSARVVSGVSMSALTAVTRALGPLPWRELAVHAELSLAALLRSPLPALTALRVFDAVSLPRFEEVLRSSLGRQLTRLEVKLSAPGEVNGVLSAALSSSLHTLKVTSTGGELTLEVADGTLRAPKLFLARHRIDLPGVSLVET